jgi:hypothetical protein
LPAFNAECQGFLKVSGRQIVNEKGENVLLRGIGLGGWMLQEPYMLQLSKVAGTQTEIRTKIAGLIGKENTGKFNSLYRKNLITRRDIDSLKVYWNPPTRETIAKYLTLRDKNNVPLWMGESGENNNDWYRSTVEMLESNNIGWTW